VKSEEKGQSNIVLRFEIDALYSREELRDIVGPPAVRKTDRRCYGIILGPWTGGPWGELKRSAGVGLTPESFERVTEPEPKLPPPDPDPEKFPAPGLVREPDDPDPDVFDPMNEPLHALMLLVPTPAPLAGRLS
jgi:hypothetical protein